MTSPRDTWEERYSAPDYVFGVAPNDFLAERVALLAPGDALCIAEGEGRNAVHLAREGWVVESFDLTDAGVRKTLALAAENGVEVDARVADASEFEGLEFVHAVETERSVVEGTGHTGDAAVVQVVARRP